MTPVVLAMLAMAMQDDTAKWRQAQEADLRRDEGWLAVAGLYWLKEGANSFGTDPQLDVALPKGTAPERCGAFIRRGDTVTVRLDANIAATVDGKPTTSTTLASDTSGRAQKLVIGGLRITVIQRGARVGIRLYHPDSPARREFRGMNWYAIDPALRVEAKFTPYSPPHRIAITNVLGDVSMVTVPGFVEFSIGGQRCRLEAQLASGGLFFNFRDKTSGDTTYPAGRFLDTEAPKDGKVTLDFNRAVNPPCAFTRFATCPLAPKENFLAVAIPAGEKVHHPSE